VEQRKRSCKLQATPAAKQLNCGAAMLRVEALIT